jgi:hypothetical protein
LEKDFYLGTLGSFDCGFTQQLNGKKNLQKEWNNSFSIGTLHDLVFMKIDKNLAQ